MNTKTGLVLEGGGTRGMYTAGVLDVMMENDISFDGIIGVSAGALFGVNFLSKQPGRAIRYNKIFNKNPKYMGIKSLITEGNLVSTKFAYGEVPRNLDPFDHETFKKSDVPFYAVVTNVDTGEPEYIQIKDVFEQMDSLRASGSMPIVSKCVEIDGKRYLDGGISDSIPAEWFAKQGFNKQVVILTRDSSYVKKPFPKAAASLLKKYPKVADRMLSRHLMYNNELAILRQYEREGTAFIICPSKPITISKTEKDETKLQEVYDLGREDCQRLIDEIRGFLVEIAVRLC